MSVDQIPYIIGEGCDHGDISVLSISDDNHYIAFGTINGFIHLFDRRTRKPHTRQCSTYPIRHLLSHDMDTIVSGSSSGVALSNFRDGSQINFDDSLEVSPLTSCHATALIAGGSPSGVMKVWKFDSPDVLHTVSTPHKDIHALAFRRDGLALASSEQAHVTVWCCKTWTPLMDLKVEHSVQLLAFSFEGLDLVVAGGGTATVFDVDRFNEEEAPWADEEEVQPLDSDDGDTDQELREEVV